MEERRQVDVDITTLENKIGYHILEEAVRDSKMAEQMKELKEQVDALTVKVDLLVDMWTQAKGVVTFIKWVAGIGSGIAASLLFIKEYIK